MCGCRGPNGARHELASIARESMPLGLHAGCIDSRCLYECMMCTQTDMFCVSVFSFNVLLILPEMHYDPQCQQVNKTTLFHGGPTRWECMAKSFVHHASNKYGIDSETVTAQVYLDTK